MTSKKKISWWNNFFKRLLSVLINKWIIASAVAFANTFSQLILLTAFFTRSFCYFIIKWKFISIVCCLKYLVILYLTMKAWIQGCLFSLNMLCTVIVVEETYSSPSNKINTFKCTLQGSSNPCGSPLSGGFYYNKMYWNYI